MPSLSRCTRAPHVTVIGAGLIGLTSAESLLRRGFRVTLLDRQPKVARECSFANAALLMRSYSRPKTASPMQLLQWATSRSQPVHVSWRALLDPSMTSFGLRFFLSGPQRQSRIWEITQVTDSLADLSGRCFDSINSERGLNVKTLDEGVLMFFTDSDKLKALVDETRSAFSEAKQRELFRVLSGQACVELEPSLRHRAGDIVGGIHWLRDRTVCPLAFSEALADSLVADGVEMRLGEEALSVTDGRVLTSRTEISTDAVVVAAGVHSGRLLRGLGVPDLPPVPLYGMRGHSLTLPLEDGPRLQRSVCDGDVMTFFSPLPGQDRLRVAAFGDFDGWGLGPEAARPWRLEQLRANAERSFPGLLRPLHATLESPPAAQSSLSGLCAEDPATRWCGLRPMSPDGLPLVGRVSSAPVFVNAGHGSLGWTLGPGCAELLAASVEGQELPQECRQLLRHLDPRRFAWGRVATDAWQQWLAPPASAAH